MSKYILKGGNLAHHGILGQKWGIRRFQNKDGSYTAEGKKRRREDSYSDDYKRIRDLKKKKPEELSTKEIEDINRRDNAMFQYNRNNIQAGKYTINRLATNILNRSLDAIAVGVVTAGTVYVKNKLRNG